MVIVAGLVGADAGGNGIATDIAVVIAVVLLVGAGGDGLAAGITDVILHSGIHMVDALVLTLGADTVVPLMHFLGNDGMATAGVCLLMSSFRLGPGQGAGMGIRVGAAISGAAVGADGLVLAGCGATGMAAGVATFGADAVVPLMLLFCHLDMATAGIGLLVGGCGLGPGQRANMGVGIGAAIGGATSGALLSGLAGCGAAGMAAGVATFGALAVAPMVVFSRNDHGTTGRILLGMLGSGLGPLGGTATGVVAGILVAGGKGSSTLCAAAAAIVINSCAGAVGSSLQVSGSSILLIVGTRGDTVLATGITLVIAVGRRVATAAQSSGTVLTVVRTAICSTVDNSHRGLCHFGITLALKEDDVILSGSIIAGTFLVEAEDIGIASAALRKIVPVQRSDTAGTILLTVLVQTNPTIVSIGSGNKDVLLHTIGACIGGNFGGANGNIDSLQLVAKAAIAKQNNLVFATRQFCIVIGSTQGGIQNTLVIAVVVVAIIPGNRVAAGRGHATGVNTNPGTGFCTVCSNVNLFATIIEALIRRQGSGAIDATHSDGLACQSLIAGADHTYFIGARLQRAPYIVVNGSRVIFLLVAIKNRPAVPISFLNTVKNVEGNVIVPILAILGGQVVPKIRSLFITRTLGEQTYPGTSLAASSCYNNRFARCIGALIGA